jgi:hypothetical protein
MTGERLFVRTLFVTVIAVLLLGALLARAAEPAYPDPKLTPGECRKLTIKEVCGTKWGKDARAVTASMKRQVMAAYQIPPARWHVIIAGKRKAAYEIDHLCSRELAGADTTANLGAQSYFGHCNAHDKDRLENRLHKEVCAAGTLAALQAAQREILTDWVKAYRKRFGPC